MKQRFSTATPGRVGLIVAMLALVVAASGQAVGLPGTGTVDSGDIQNGTVRFIDTRMATVRVTGDGAIVQTRFVLGTSMTANVLCLDLAFTPKTGSATRAVDNGGDFTAPNIGVPPTPAQLGCAVGFQDAVVQVPGQPDLNGTYANFFG